MDGRTASPLAPPLSDAVAASWEWWAEAGVDQAFRDEPHDWLAKEDAPQSGPAAAPPVASVQQPAPSPPRPRLGGDRAAWPGDLAAFRAWWLEEPALDDGGLSPRIAGRGDAGAPLMILVPMPESGDTDTLLSGPQGRLLASFVSAAGLDAGEVSYASALARHTPMPDWQALAGRGLGDILLHHLELAAPRRLLVLGNNLLPLIGHDPAQPAPATGEIAIQAGKLPFLPWYSPERLLGTARLREGLWRRWLDWTDG